MAELDLLWKNRVFLIFLLIVILALFLRFDDLDYKPLHHDEGNIWYNYVNKIIFNESMTYYPYNHGFTPFYLSAIPLFFEDSIFSFRFIWSLIGGLLVVSFWPLRKIIGNFAMLISAFLIATSPTMIYYSKFGGFAFMLVNLISILFIYFGIKLYKTHNPIWLYLIFIFLAVGITSHEIILMPFMFFLISFLIFSKIKKINLINFFSSIKLIHVIFAILIFILIIVSIMSCGLSNFNNLSNISLNAFGNRLSEGHDGDLFYYFLIFLPIELILFFGVIIFLLFFKKSFMNYFLLFWCFGTIALLTLFSYKIPWLFTVAILPMSMIAGVGFNFFIKCFEKNFFRKIFLGSIIFCLLILLLVSNWVINYYQPLGKAGVNPLNYVGPTEDVFRLVEDINKIKFDHEIRMLFALKGHWPLNYYFRNKNIDYLELDPEDVDLTQYSNYEVVVINSNTTFNPSQFYVFGVYELRENFFITILFSKQYAFFV